MIIVHVRVQKVTIERFSLRDQIELRIYFDDGKKKATIAQVDLAEPEGSAERIMFKIRSHEKKENSRWNDIDSDSLLGNVVNVIVKDEEAVTKRIAAFIREISAKVHQLKSNSSRQDYLYLFSKVKDMKVMIENEE